MSRLQFVINFGMYTLSGRVRTMFEVGDVVTLKSGGPSMTVAEILDGGLVNCVWFAGTKTTYERFAPLILTKADPPKQVILDV